MIRQLFFCENRDWGKKCTDRNEKGKENVSQEKRTLQRNTDENTQNCVRFPNAE